ncbi:hypothetical protein BDK51DRAFT_28953 [Blyttiomyces helicus]|uniref:CCHC-type domain-containing protein n=1 Tax=Blyttiomyces helicus TaxID=388810 RepID=A0A4P9WJP8_9FUNG|nr:hypothetical protein BDK51DRAFT_28953 [Blyttiomyces helicus]|eukprot:RKO93161.1 hypothetical protein BDK51DRAFT_28953 [Blyttiomyces helicus]
MMSGGAHPIGDHASHIPLHPPPGLRLPMPNGPGPIQPHDETSLLHAKQLAEREHYALMALHHHHHHQQEQHALQYHHLPQLGHPGEYNQHPHPHSHPHAHGHAHPHANGHGPGLPPHAYLGGGGLPPPPRGYGDAQSLRYLGAMGNMRGPPLPQYMGGMQQHGPQSVGHMGGGGGGVAGGVGAGGLHLVAMNMGGPAGGGPSSSSSSSVGTSSGAPGAGGLSGVSAIHYPAAAAAREDAYYNTAAVLREHQVAAQRDFEDQLCAKFADIDIDRPASQREEQQRLAFKSTQGLFSPAQYPSYEDALNDTAVSMVKPFLYDSYRTMSPGNGVSIGREVATPYRPSATTAVSPSAAEGAPSSPSGTARTPRSTRSVGQSTSEDIESQPAPPFKPYTTAPPAGYVCKLCFVDGHWLKNCVLYRERRRDSTTSLGSLAYSGRSFSLGSRLLGGQRVPLKTSTPPKGYVCRKCNLAGHWIQQCSQQKHSVPPESYTCKICTMKGHWIYQCPQRVPKSMMISF